MGDWPSRAAYVTDSSVASGTALYNRLTEMVSVMDPLYGAKGDGTTDDTTSIQACIAANAYVFFPPGKTFKTTATINVPTTCLRIDGTGAFMTGPGISGTVDAFTFTGFYQGGGSIPVKSEKYILPSLNGYRYGVNLTNCGFLRIFSDTIENVVCGYFATCNSSSNYCFELELEARYLWHCRNAANTLGAAFYMQSTGNSNNAFQGNRCKAFYCDDCWAGVYQEFSSTGTNGNINNEYDLGELDQSTYAVYCTPAPHSSQQLFKFPMGITSPQNSQMFVNCSTQDMYEVGGMVFNDPTFTAFNNFQYNGCSNRPAIPVYGSGSTMTVYVSASGSDVTGTGNSNAPFASIQKALNVLMGLDLFGKTAIISVQDGTYSSGALCQALGGNSASGQITIQGNIANPGNVVVNNVGATSFAANGADADLLIAGMTINGGVLAQNGGLLQIGPSIVFGNNVGGAHIQAQNGGGIQINSNYSVTGQASYHYNATLNGVIQNAAATSVTFTGTIPFTTVANAAQGGQISVPGITYSGSSVSGQKYTATLNGVIWTNGGGASYFPGTVAGSTSTGGQYA